ncbi:alpha/beta hydrolase [Paracoccus benzoatiresistens]|uniref:Alpha/beta hydrolase n=1 Tax=Paracoccus benzoatiresistens TaxID=2997341 RepID=A0ABT4J5K1_9RHOB|nr:alpha/beta hydrolase [Paracoccus sp. EF6]MCZ0961902.1 alpha/beta hydrolase [Paracoccus sp. EF6]
MPVVKVDADHAPPPGLTRALGALPGHAPVILMIHGYRYSPAAPRCDPHRHILSLDPDRADRRALSWPRALGFGAGAEDEGLAIAFGWEARGMLGQAYARAGDAGRQVAALASAVADRAGRPVAVIAHSLGARVALQALHGADPGSIGRIVLLAGAEFRDTAAAALDSPAGRRAEVLNVTSRENDLFDYGMELWLDRGRRQALGFGLERPAGNWLDVQIDDQATLAALESLGFPVERRPLRLSHWTPYLRRGLFDFYRTALAQPWALSLPMLRARLPGRIEARWSRLLALPAPLGGVGA